MMRSTQRFDKGARRPGLSGRRGFTLTEMLVVIGIIVLVLGITTPMITRAWRTGDRTRSAADLAAISTALEAYRQDHKMYPPVGAANTGFAVLAKALAAPGGTTGAPAYSPTVDYSTGDAVSQGAVEYVALNDPPLGTAVTDVNYW